MEFLSKNLKQISETKYLAVDNTDRYRAIVQILYANYKRFSYFLYKEEIFEEMKNSGMFSEYTIELCEQDIARLIEWKNIVGSQDTARAASIEEFKNKRFRYQIEEKTIIIERMVTEELEKLIPNDTSLDPNLLERIKDGMEIVHKRLDINSENLTTWWNNFVSDFNRLTKNYSGYLSKLNSFKMEELMNTTQFILYKDNLVEYLRNFVKGLQQYGLIIAGLMKNIDEEKIAGILYAIAENEKKLMVLNPDLTVEEIHKEICGKWDGIKNWFTGNVKRKSELEIMYDKTNEIIRKIVRIAMQIAESKKVISSRKEDYLKAAELFSKCGTIDEAHCLSAVLFGAFNSKHIKGLISYEAKGKNASIFEYIPAEVKLTPRTRSAKEKKQVNVVIDKTHKKAELIREEQKRREEEEQKVKELTKDGKVVFSELGVIAKETRKTFLRWIVRGIETPAEKEEEIINGLKYKAFPFRKNETGSRYRVMMNEFNDIELKCDDGIFIMPDIIIEIEKGD